MSLLHRLNLAHKFIILGALALLMAALPTTMYLRQSLAEIDAAKLEARGAAPVIALQRVVQLMQQHRGLSAGMLGGNEALAAKLPQVRSELGKAVESLETRLQAAQAGRATLAAWAERKQAWAALEKAVAARALKPAESSAQHTALIAQLLMFNADVLDEFGLSLDPVADSYAMIMASFVDAPALTERLGQMRAQGTGFLATGSIAPEGRVALAAIRGRANELFGEMSRNLGKATAANAGLKRELFTKADALNAQIGKTLAMADQSLIKATELKMPANEYFEDFTKTINAVYDFNAVALQALTSLLDERVATLQRSAIIMLSVLATLLAVVLGVAVMFVRSITGPLQEALDLAEAVSEGDLTRPIAARGNDEIGRLMQALVTMKDKLSGIVSEVRQNADSVATGSEEIARGNQDLSQRTAEQEGALEEATASMHRLGAAVTQNAGNAQQANQLAQGASAVAVKGGEVVGRVVQTMQGINDSSKKIAEIIGVIDGIAFQTNILALNAAVEAARAGEQGRGFAVVASEVRNLAQRSAAAAREIKSLIGVSVERVEHGSTLVDQAGATMAEVVAAIKRVTEIMGEISAASSEQSAGVAQVGEAVGRMNQSTQQNAALVEQSAAAAESLKDQAQRLVSSVAVFKVRPGDEADAAATPAVAGVSEAAHSARPERRGPNRAKNVARPAFGAKLGRAGAAPAHDAAAARSARTGSDDWTSY